MWILENEGEALGRKKVWLRPGKRYLFGRTVAEPGQLAIQGPGSEKVSRKHVTITISEVEEGHAEVMGSRSRVTIEDLGSKGGTKVNGQKYRGETCTLLQDTNTLQMGSFPALFRITWLPVVLSFSFTGNQLRTRPIERLRQSLEQLDIKLLSDYDVQLTTHVVSKKRNTPKGLQALINGKYIVNDGFIDGITAAATTRSLDSGVTTSSLEQDFDANWPDPMQFLPPPGEEPVPRQPESFAPNPARLRLFEGYTFVFYEQKQFDNLLAPITNGRGKALLHVAVAGETQIDDFIRFVKGVAGEKGLGAFEDGSEGKGVVVVKWMPSSEENGDWFADFFRTLSLRLDHRLIDQKDFLDAILSNDASGLRRPLEFESPPGTAQQQQPPVSIEPESMEVEPPEDTALQPQIPVSRRRGRGPVKSRFRGFAVSVKEDDDDAGESIAMVPDVNDATPAPTESSEGGLFVTQDMSNSEMEVAIHTSQPSQRLQRKRSASPLPEREDVMNQLAPTAAQVKRRRIAAGEDPIPKSREIPTPPVETSRTVVTKQPKIKQEIDILEMARQHREEAEERAKMEREELEAEPGDLDLAEIRRLHIEELMPLRELPQGRTRDQDIADGRWDPSWNGRKNFKRFRQRGAVQGRTVEKIIVALEEVKSKGFGIGDDCWLEDSSISQQQRPKKQTTESYRQQTGSGPSHTKQTVESSAVEESARRGQQNQDLIDENLQPVDSDDEVNEDVTTGGNANGDGERDDGEENEDDVIMTSSSRTRGATRAASTNTTRSQSRLSTQTPQPSTTSIGTKAQAARRATGKRAAAAPPAKEKPAKRAKSLTANASDEDSDNDGLRFRGFGRRRG